MTTITAQWAKCATCGISYLQEDKDAKDCQSCLREKAALFDWLATATGRIGIDPIPSGTFGPDHSFFTLWVRQDGKRYCYEAPTLAEAVAKAMESEERQ